MGWGRYFLLGNIGQQLDLQDRERDMEHLRGELDSQFSRDAAQDSQIDALRRQLQESQLYLGAIVRLLVQKGLATEAEIKQTVDLVEQTEQRKR